MTAQLPGMTLGRGDVLQSRPRPSSTRAQPRSSFGARPRQHASSLHPPPPAPAVAASVEATSSVNRPAASSLLPLSGGLIVDDVFDGRPSARPRRAEGTSSRGDVPPDVLRRLINGDGGGGGGLAPFLSPRPRPSATATSYRRPSHAAKFVEVTSLAAALRPRLRAMAPAPPPRPRPPRHHLPCPRAGRVRRKATRSGVRSPQRLVAALTAACRALL